MKVLIDSGVWSLGLKTAFLSRSDPALEKSIVAQRFLRSSFADNHEILFSTQLLTNLFEALTRSGNQIPADQARRFVEDLFARKTTIVRPVTQTIFARSMQLSSQSGIALAPYLIVFPFEDRIDVIYTADPVYQHKHFQSLAEIVNPLA